MTKPVYGYVIRDPKGRLYPDTFGCHKPACWENAYLLINRELKWGGRYWERWDASTCAAEKAGWRIVKVKLVPVTKERP